MLQKQTLILSLILFAMLSTLFLIVGTTTSNSNLKNKKDVVIDSNEVLKTFSRLNNGGDDLVNATFDLPYSLDYIQCSEDYLWAASYYAQRIYQFDLETMSLVDSFALSRPYEFDGFALDVADPTGEFLYFLKRSDRLIFRAKIENERLIVYNKWKVDQYVSHQNEGPYYWSPFAVNSELGIFAIPRIIRIRMTGYWWRTTPSAELLLCPFDASVGKKPKLIYDLTAEMQYAPILGTQIGGVVFDKRSLWILSQDLGQFFRWNITLGNTIGTGADIPGVDLGDPHYNQERLVGPAFDGQFFYYHSNNHYTIAKISLLKRTDADGDGLSDFDEAQKGLDPWNPDTDNDLMPDLYELEHGFDPLDPADGAQDFDNDGLTNGQEYVYGTNPFIPDSDDDGLLDGEEIKKGTNPLNPDSDFDGIIDSLDNNPIEEALLWERDQNLTVIGIIALLIGGTMLYLHHRRNQ